MAVTTRKRTRKPGFTASLRKLLTQGKEGDFLSTEHIELFCGVTGLRSPSRNSLLNRAIIDAAERGFVWSRVHGRGIECVKSCPVDDDKCVKVVHESPCGTSFTICTY